MAKPKPQEPKPRRRLSTVKMLKKMEAEREAANEVETASEDSPPQANAAIEVRLGVKPRQFLELYRQYGFKEERKAALAAGYTRSSAGPKLVKKLRPIIEEMRLAAKMGTQIEVDETLSILAEICRDDTDRKTQLAAVRTSLQVHGILNDKPMAPGDRRQIVKQLQDLAASIKAKLAQSVHTSARPQSLLAAPDPEETPAPDASEALIDVDADVVQEADEPVVDGLEIALEGSIGGVPPWGEEAKRVSAAPKASRPKSVA